MDAKKPKILFIAENATLAHVTRPLLLAESLSHKEWEVYFAADNAYNFLFSKGRFKRLPLSSVAPKDFLDTLEQGGWPYQKKRLLQNVEEDIALIKEIEPDLIVGDLRLSLTISAPHCQIPYISLTNGYWSPFAKYPYTPVPVYRTNRYFGLTLANFLFQRLRPYFVRFHCKPLNQVRKLYGFEPFQDLSHAFTAGSCTLYCDIPSLVETEGTPPHHHYIGSLSWSPKNGAPHWWNNLSQKKRTVYLTLGSSGNDQVLHLIIKTLTQMNYQIILSSAGKKIADIFPETVYADHFLPGKEAAQRADYVICNGGSPTSYQALQAGKPVIGIASNLDHFLCMQSIERAGAGILLRSDTLSEEKISSALSAISDNPQYTHQALKLKKQFEAFNATQLFQQHATSLMKQYSTQKVLVNE